MLPPNAVVEFTLFLKSYEKVGELEEVLLKLKR